MVVTLLLLLVMGCAPNETRTWPQIMAFEKEYQFDSPMKASVDLTINDQGGNPKYRLECRNYLYDGNPDFYFSGDFECRLESLYSKETVSTLLTYRKDQSADRESRALFYAAHFMGACKSSPYGGRPRTFRLRNMKIVLHIYDERVVLEEIDGRRTADFESFSFRVKVSRDDGAIHDIADDISRDSLPIWFHRPSMCLERSVIELK